MLNEALLDEFAAHEASLRRIGAELGREIGTLLAAAGVQVQFVSWRVKSAESLRRKLGRPDKTYRELWDVTDLVGVRVGTYFEDTLDEVARLVEERFAVDFRHSADKLRFTDHGRFGYRSLHYVCALPAEQAPHPDFRFELQLRTALQHAWAEVEHDLGYKANDPVPEQIRRRFSRVASLLEIADQEFVSIRRDLGRYRAQVREELATAGSSLPLDTVSLDAIVRAPELAALDQVVAQALQRPCKDEPFFPAYLVKMLQLAGLRTTDAVLAAVRKHGDDVAAVVFPYFECAEKTFGLDPRALDAVARGYSLLFVAHLCIVRVPDLGLSKVARLTRLYFELDYPHDERAAHRVAIGMLHALGG